MLTQIGLGQHVSTGVYGNRRAAQACPERLFRELPQQSISFAVEFRSTLLEIGNVILHPPHVGGGLPGVGPIDGRFTHGSVALRVVVEVVMENELLAGEVECSVQRRDLVSEPEKGAFGSLHSAYREGDSNPHGLASNGF